MPDTRSTDADFADLCSDLRAAGLDTYAHRAIAAQGQPAAVDALLEDLGAAGHDTFAERLASVVTPIGPYDTGGVIVAVVVECPSCGLAVATRPGSAVTGCIDHSRST